MHNVIYPLLQLICGVSFPHLSVFHGEDFILIKSKLALIFVMDCASGVTSKS